MEKLFIEIVKSLKEIIKTAIKEFNLLLKK